MKKWGAWRGCCKAVWLRRLLTLVIRSGRAMQTEFSYYDVLGIAATASQDEIKAAYRAAILKYHPDVNSAPNAQRLTEILNEAYAVLSDPLKRRQYDTGIAPAAATPEDEAAQIWDLYACDRCGRNDVHLRYALFYKVWSILLYTQMKGEGGVLCPECRSKVATSTAMFSAFLGSWGLPWGVIYTLRSLFASVRGGELPRQQNAQLLRHQAIAFLQRGYINEARTSLEAAQSFEKNEAAANLLKESFFNVSTIIPKQRWLRGQSTAVALFAVPPILVFLLLVWLGSGASTTSSPNSSPQAESQTQLGQAQNDDAIRAIINKCKAKPTSSNAQSRYDSCKSTISWLSDDIKNAPVMSEESQMDEIYSDVARSYQSIAAYELGRKTESNQIDALTMKSLSNLKDNGVTGAVRSKAKNVYDCLRLGKCE